MVTLSVMGVRQLGMLQTWELQAFDHLMRKLPPEPEDKRLLIIGVDEEDINQYGHPLPDAVLAQLLDKLKAYQPSAIGLDIVRDQPQPKDDSKGHEAFAVHLQQNKQLITVCAFNNKGLKDSILPPPQSPKSQVGFVNLPKDSDFNKQDNTIRRYLLSRTLNPNSTRSRCTANHSFALHLAYQYFKSKNISVNKTKNDWKFGSVVVKPLENHSGGYQTLEARGNQLLIRYRNTSQINKIAQQVTVRDVLNNRNGFDYNWSKNQVIIIGMIASSDRDLHDTPYGITGGIYIHAHAVSQILSAVEDDRPLIWSWTQWVDALWIMFWSFTGGVIFWRLQIPLHRRIIVSVSIVILYGLCWFVLTKGGWIPLIPPALALAFTGGSVAAYITFHTRKYH
jgi:CHASE2 domain-containing sensor protein